MPQCRRSWLLAPSYFPISVRHAAAQCYSVSQPRYQVPPPPLPPSRHHTTPQSAILSAFLPRVLYFEDAVAPRIPHRIMCIRLKIETRFEGRGHDILAYRAVALSSGFPPRPLAMEAALLCCVPCTAPCTAPCTEPTANGRHSFSMYFTKGRIQSLLPSGVAPNMLRPHRHTDQPASVATQRRELSRWRPGGVKLEYHVHGAMRRHIVLLQPPREIRAKEKKNSKSSDAALCRSTAGRWGGATPLGGEGGGGR